MNKDKGFPDPQSVINLAIKKFIEKGLEYPEEFFSSGHCQYFANMLLSLYPEGILYSTSNHVGVKIDNFIWDIEGIIFPDNKYRPDSETGFSEINYYGNPKVIELCDEVVNEIRNELFVDVAKGSK